MRINDPDIRQSAEDFFDWDFFDVILGRLNAIDLPRLHIHNEARAKDFIGSYGYDPDNPRDLGELASLREEALAYIENNLLVNPERPEDVLHISVEVLRETDPLKLLIWASEPACDRQRWSCSVLRVMHTMAHAGNDLDFHLFPHIQNQVLNAVLRHVYSDPTGDIYLGENDRGLRLYILDIKSQKTQESTILKLLHKKEHIGAELFDRLGFRFVTFTRAETLAALKYMQDRFMISYVNVKTSRSRNTLMNMEAFRAAAQPWLEAHAAGSIDDDGLWRNLEELCSSPQCRPQTGVEERRQYNLYSSTSYRSIQFTARMLVRASLGGRAGGRDDAEGSYRFFFPFEIQILDKQSYIESRRGRAGHTEYKKAQLMAVRRRIFPWLGEEERI